jgi:hypothetical protein
MVVEARRVVEDYEKRMSLHKIWSVVFQYLQLAKASKNLRSDNIVLESLRQTCFVDLQWRERDHRML